MSNELNQYNSQRDLLASDRSLESAIGNYIEKKSNNSTPTKDIIVSNINAALEMTNSNSNSIKSNSQALSVPVNNSNLSTPSKEPSKHMIVPNINISALGDPMSTSNSRSISIIRKEEQDPYLSFKNAFNLPAPNEINGVRPSVNISPRLEVVPENSQSHSRKPTIVAARSSILSPASENRKMNHNTSPRDWNFLGRAIVETIRHFDSYRNPGGEEDSKYKSNQSKLGLFSAACMSSKDLLSSVMFTTGTTAQYAGFYAPLCLLLVSLTLLAYRSCYVEVVTALPLNWGSYTAMLNTSSKTNAAITGCIAYLSYVCTGVVAAVSAVTYVQFYWPELNFVWGTLAIILIMAIINLLGVREAAPVAVILCSIHVCTMLTLIFSALTFGFNEGWATLIANYNGPGPENVGSAIVYGFSAAMLGITGFETSSNFVEQQQTGVYSQTLTIIIILLTFLNPSIAFFAFTVLPTSMVTDPIYSTNVLIYMAQSISFTFPRATFLPYLVFIDSVLILNATVYTSFINSSGLCASMAKDGLLPDAFIHKNEYTGVNSVSLIVFWFFSSFLVVGTNGDSNSMSTIFTIAFCSVLTIMVIGTIFLKFRRSSLVRELRASYTSIIVALFSGLLAIVSALIHQPIVIAYFFLFFAPIVFFVMLYHFRVTIIIFLLSEFAELSPQSQETYSWVKNYLTELLYFIEASPIILLTNYCDIKWLNEAIQYVRENEATRLIKVVHICDDVSLIPEHFDKTIQILNDAYPSHRIDATVFEGHFTPEMLNNIASMLNVSKHSMLIGCPSQNSSRFNFAELGGARIISSEQSCSINAPLMKLVFDQSEINLTEMNNRDRNFA